MLTTKAHERIFRPTGIDIMKNKKWGTHFCSIFETPEDLIFMMVSYFKAGLENNEYCVYVVADSQSIPDIVRTIGKAIAGIERYINEGSIKIITYSDLMGSPDNHTSDEMLAKWDELLEMALLQGYEGLRINNDHFFSGQTTSLCLAGPSVDIQAHIKNKNILVLSTCPVSECSAAEIIEIITLHGTVCVKRNGLWDLFESEKYFNQSNSFSYPVLSYEERLENRIIEGTRKLNEANKDLEISIKQRMLTRDALQNAEANLYSLFNNIRNSIIVLDKKLNILLFNNIASSRAAQDFGRRYTHGANIIDILDEGRKEKMKRDCFDALRGKEVVYESMYPAENNSECWYLVRIFPVINDDGVTTGLCISAEDITQRKVAETEREKMTVDLLQRNGDLEQFSYMVSHNLRAPVANIMGFSDLCKDDKCPEEIRKDFIEQIHRSSHKLDEEIRDLNDILKVRSGPGDLSEELQFSGIVKNVTEKISSVIDREKAVIITDFSNEPAIKGNRIYLNNIFLNLITNSIKYHQPGIPPVIEITTQRLNDKIVIKFTDNGLGIDLNRNSDKVFGLYKRFHSEIEGKGIGLFMVKTQVDILGGNIKIDSKVNIGTSFTIELNQ